MSCKASPLRSLQEGHWFKLICGASYQYLPAIEHLTRSYALAGADCIDVAADPGVVAVASQVLRTLSDWSDLLDMPLRRPWLMVSLNDAEDPHFRKAVFDPQACPPDCPRPCIALCPTQAIRFADPGVESEPSGVQADRCYGCGRCLPVCPLQHIQSQSHLVPAAELLPQLLDRNPEEYGIDALELHTQVGHAAAFADLWATVRPWLPRLKLIAISCPYAPGVVDYLRWIASIVTPLPCPLLWQTDGRPMSGDIGSGTTHTAIHFAQELLSTDLPGFVQLAGGTNAYTVPKLLSLGLLSPTGAEGEGTRKVSGIAYGSYARKLLDKELDTCPGVQAGSDYGVWLQTAVTQAQTLVLPLKHRAPQTV
ncbi:MAG: circadian clock protein LdpA [Prochlorotrichaceae cyanobacterium]